MTALPTMLQVRPAVSANEVAPAVRVVKLGFATTVPPMPLRSSKAYSLPRAGAKANVA
jgi:hypothetical protein